MFDLQDESAYSSASNLVKFPPLAAVSYDGSQRGAMLSSVAVRAFPREINRETISVCVELENGLRPNINGVRLHVHDPIMFDLDGLTLSSANL